jgi:lysyl-tRNA synthetase class 2
LERLKQGGLDPYPSTTNRTHTNKQALDDFDTLADKLLVLVGRIRSWRDMGKITFVHIEDGTAKIQCLLKEDDLGESYKFFVKNFDLGDFVQIEGKLFKTKTGEKTLAATGYKLLAKSLLPLPSEHFGLADEEERLRKRYLDILLNAGAKEIFVKKARFWNSMRQFLQARNFLHLDMPILESSTGGAEARPFITHHNSLDRDFFLRISLELPLKKMLVAGFEKVFEIGRIFRNEGISTEHLQDYTQMEFYWAYASFEDMMDLVREMYQKVIEETFGTLVITARGQTVDWSGKWEKVSYIEIFKKHTGIDLLTAQDEDLKKYCDSHNLKYEAFAGRGRLIDLIFKEVRKNIPAQKPVFLVDQPIELEPLAKRDPKNPRLVQRMQIIAYGTELGKGFGELNDPIDQRLRFEEQASLRAAGDEEAQMLDEHYVEAMEYGMPPCAGFGLSERLFAILADKSIRETVVFPLMKESAKGPAKAKENLLAVAVISKGAGLEAWKELNTVAHLNAAFAARMTKKGHNLFQQDEIKSKDGKNIKLNIRHAIMIKTATSNQELKKLAGEAKQHGLEVAEFTKEMLESTNDKKVAEWTAQKPHEEIEHLGILVFGPESKVKELTGQLPLYK